MESLITEYILPNWQRKCVALIAAIVIWVSVNHSIIDTKTIPNVPIRIANLPPDKTMIGLLSNGNLKKRITLTVSGTKDIIDRLEPGDLEVVIDASNTPDEWIAQITKKNLISLNPEIDLSRHITQVTHSEFVVKMSKLVSAKIPVTIFPPTGLPPKGYEFLDIWPEQLTHTVRGPEEQLATLQSRGLELTFDLNDISKAELDAIKNSSQNSHEDEVSYPVPLKWKQVVIPFLNNKVEEINDPDAQQLHIDFLRKQVLSIKGALPVRVFYPLESLSKINPTSYPLATNHLVAENQGVYTINAQLFASNISQLFLEVVRNNLEISVVAAPVSDKEPLEWGVDFIDQHDLENKYIALMMKNKTLNKKDSSGYFKVGEAYLRNRFRDYMQKFTLLKSPNKKFELDSKLENEKIVLEEP